jgi:hypothetical protein
MWQIQGLRYSQSGGCTRGLPLQSIDNVSVVDGYSKCKAVGRPGEICTSSKMLVEANLTHKPGLASPSRVPCCKLTQENVRTTIKALSSNTRSNRNIILALSEGISLCKSSNCLSSKSLRASLLADIHSRDKFSILFSTQTPFGYKHHFPPTESQRSYSALHKPHIFASRGLPATENPPLCLQNPQEHIVQNRSKRCQEAIFHPDRESTSHSNHISEPASSPTRPSTSQESRGTSDNPILNESQDLRKFC